jgi:hypothetical protein
MAQADLNWDGRVDVLFAAAVMQKDGSAWSDPSPPAMAFSNAG